MTSLRLPHPALHTVHSAVPGHTYSVPDLPTLDRVLAHLLDLAATTSSLTQRTALRADIDRLLLRRVWLTLPVDETAREWADRHPPL